MDLRRIAGFAAGPVMSAAFGAITLPVLTWTFSAEDIGRLAMLQLVATLSVVVFSLGMDQAYVRDYHEVTDRSKGKLLIAAVSPGIVAYSIAVAAVVTFSPALPAAVAFDKSSVIWSVGLMVAALISLVSRFLALVLRMREHGFAFSMSQSLPKLLFLLAVLAAWIFHFDAFGLLLSANIATMAVVLVAYGYYTRGAWVPGLSEPFDWHAARRMLLFGLPLVLGGLASWAVMAQDKLLLRHFSNMQELGVYSVAATLASAAALAATLFNTIWTPTVYKWHAQGNALPRIEAGIRHVTSATCVLIALAGIFSPATFLVLPKQYSLVPSILPACMILPLFYSLSEATAVGLGLGRKTLYSMLASVIASLLGLAAGAILIPVYGARGAATSAVVAGTSFLVARTELACLAWQPITRKSTYTSSCIVSALAILCANCAYSALWPVIWLVILAGAAAIYRESVTAFCGLMLQFVRGARTGWSSIKRRQNVST